MTNSQSHQHLYRLHELGDYEVVNNDPDIRDWPVIGSDGKKLGVVNELIVDKEEERVRYVDVITGPEFAHAGGERHLIIPVGFVKIGEEPDDQVYINDLESEKLLNTPIFFGGPVTRDYEHQLREVLHGKEDLEHKEFYHDPYFDDSGLSGRTRNNRKND